MIGKQQIPTKGHFGKYSFDVTPNHFPLELVAQLKYSSDDLADSAIRSIQRIVKENRDAAKTASAAPCIYTTDFYTIARDFRLSDPVLERLWAETHKVPPWVDWEQIGRGQKFLYRYLIGNIAGYIHQAFIAENAASPSTAEVLVRSGGFSTKIMLRRVFETAQFVIRVTHSLSDIQPGGDGHAMVIRMRLIHAMIRARITRICEQRDDYFDMTTFGVPLNILDQIHTIAVFACNNAVMQLPYFGVHPTPQEVADYTALWRYIGYVHGVPDEYFSSSQRAKETLESMVLHQLRVTPTSQTLCYNFVQGITDLGPPNVSVGFIEAVSRLINGDELCDELALGRPGLIPRACARGLSWLILAMAWIQWLVPPFDLWIVTYWRQLLYSKVILNKYSANKHLGRENTPMLGKKIGKESHGRTVSASWSSTLLLSRPVELFLFACFVIGLLVMVASLGILWYSARRVFARVLILQV